MEIWPDTRPAFELFSVLRTQWRVGTSGPTGLDYNVLYRKMDRMELTPDEYDQLEGDITVMEAAALEEIYREQ